MYHESDIDHAFVDAFDVHNLLLQRKEIAFEIRWTKLPIE